MSSQLILHQPALSASCTMDPTTDGSGMLDAPLSLLRDTAADIVHSRTDKSNLFDPDAEANLPRYDSSEVILGKILGRGGFCVAQEVSSLRLTPCASQNSFRKLPWRQKKVSKTCTARLNNEEESVSGSEEPSRESLAERSNRKGKPRFVIKSLSDDWSGRHKMTYMKGVVDLAVEAKFLSVLSHPNIIKLRATSKVGPFQEGYFIMIDYLPETLPHRLRQWAIIDRQTRGITGKLTGAKKKKGALVADRLIAAYDIVNAMSYLHEMNVIYRDLKPDNIGFGSQGRVKLFDFGLAKELSACEKDKDANYNLTGFTGAVRYMAPEVAKKQPYNLSADVYSFGILFWYMMALEPPFCLYTNEMIVDRVCTKGSRPLALASWPEDYGNLMKLCWNENSKIRPTFKDIKESLRKLILEGFPHVSSVLDIPNDLSDSDMGLSVSVKSLASTRSGYSIDQRKPR